MREISFIFRKIISRRFLFAGVLPILIIGTANAQQTYTFTAAGAVGAVGPTQAQINSAYLSTNLSGSVISNLGIQSFTVPNTGLYLIDAIGASGGNTNSTYNKLGGLGARMQGEFNLTAGTVLSILVGQVGVNGCGTGGGGGGSYVVANGTLLLIAAGAGGGASSDNNAANAVTVTAGTNDNPGGAVLGGTNGLGGNACNVGSPGANHGGGGGGYLGNGATSTAPTPGGGGLAFVNGGTGGTGNAPGGFGGGGGGTNCTVGGGGGGGYSGGAGGQQVNYCLNGPGRTGGGGGGSYNAGTSQTNTAAYNLGDGRVILKELCNVYIWATPAANSLAPAMCAGNTLTLSTNSIGSFTWSNSNTTNTSIVVAPTSNTVYGIVGTGSNSCLASNSISITVNSGNPALSINASTTQVCLGRTATLTASGAITYSWTGGVVNGVSFVPSLTSTYVVTGQNGCGTSTAAVSISVTPLPVSAIANPSVVCVGNTSALNLSTTANSFTWQPINQVNTLPTYVVAPNVTTIYTVTASDGTCSGTATMQVVANPVPTITAIASSTVICPPSSVTITANGGNSYTWSPGSIVASSIVVSPNISSNYQVTGINNFSCTASAQQVVLVGSQPTLSPQGIVPMLCLGQSATLVATGAGSYQWSNGPTTSVNVVSPTQSTVYTVTGTSPNHPCASFRTYSVNVFSPTVNMNVPSSICLGQTATLSASGANNYTWFPGNLTFPSVSLSPTVTTVYTVSAMSSSLNVNCVIQKTTEVIVNALPTITASATKSTICRYDKGVLNASGASSYTWTSASATLGTAASVTVPLNTAGVQFFTVTAASSEGCLNSKGLQISVLTCSGLNEFKSSIGILIFPNPNSGEFYLQGESEIYLSLFSETGQLLRNLHLNPENKFQVKISDLPKGIYFVGNGGTTREKIVIE